MPGCVLILWKPLPGAPRPPQQWIAAIKAALGASAARLLANPTLESLRRSLHGCKAVVALMPPAQAAPLLDAAKRLGARAYIAVVALRSQPTPGAIRICGQPGKPCTYVELVGLREAQEIVIRGPLVGVRTPAHHS